MTRYKHEFVMRGSGDYVNETAGETLGEHKLVYRGVDGYWYLADADAAATMPVLGITMSAIQATKKGEVLTEGYIGDISWSWTGGDEIYASTTPGELTATAPSGVGDVVQVVAIAVDQYMIQFTGNVAGKEGKPWSSVTESTYIIFNDGTNFHAKNGTTGLVEYTSASGNTIINNVVSALPSGGNIALKPGSYGAVTIDVAPSNLYIEGESKRGVVFTSLTFTNAAGTRANPLVLRDFKVEGTLSIERCSNLKLDSLLVFQVELKAVWTCKASNVDVFSTPNGEYGIILTTSGAEFCTNCYFNRCQVSDGGTGSGVAYLDKSQTTTFDQLWSENMEAGIELLNFAAFTEIRHSKIEVDTAVPIIEETDNTVGPTWVDKNYIIGASATYFYYSRSLSAQSGTVISGNTVVNLAAGATGIHLQGSSGVTITENTFRPTDLAADIVEAGSADNNVIRNNVCPNGVTVIGDNTYGYEEFIYVTDPDTNIGTHPALVLTNAVNTTVYGQIKIPHYACDVVSVNAVVVPGANGDIRYSGSSNWGIPGSQDYNTDTDSLALTTGAGLTQNELALIDLDALFTDLGAADLAGFTFTRNGISAGDTINADCYYLGVVVRYV